MKSILFISLMNGSAWGGSEEQWFRLALWMAKKNYSVAVSCFNWPGKEEKINALNNESVELFLLPSKNNSLLSKLKLQRLVNSIPFEKYDLVFVNQGGFEDITHAPFKNIYKRCKKIITSSHNYNEQGKLSLARKRSLNTWFSRSSLNIADSQKIFDTLQQFHHVEIPKQKVIYNPIGFPVPDTITPFPNKDNESVLFTMMAALDIERKAQDVLIIALASEKWRNRNWQLYLYGEGKDREKLEQLVKQKNLSDHIYLKGHTSAVVSALTESNLNLQITHIDAMPISVVEAMALSRPCVVSKVGDMPVWVTHEVNGYISNAVNEVAIDAALENAWQQKDKWKNVGENAFKKFQDLYPAPYEEKLINLMEKIVTGKI